MPIFDLECNECSNIFEFLWIKSYEVPVCPKCQSTNVKKIISSFHYRDDPDTVKKNLPDPVPPLTELINKNMKGYEGGYKEIANDQRQLKEYRRRKDRLGNTEWLPIERQHFDMGKNK